MNRKFIAKPNTYFKVGTECKLIFSMSQGDYLYGEFQGIHAIDTIAEMNKFPGHNFGDEIIINEICSFNDFDIVER